MIQVFDYQTNKPIKLFVDINNQDSFKKIKEKIFISYDLNKNIISIPLIALNDGKNYILSEESLNNKNIKKLFVYNLIDNLDNFISKNIELFLEVNEKSKEIKDLLDKFKPIYTDLNIDSLVIVVKYLMLNYFPIKEYEEDYRKWLITVKTEQTTLIKKYSLVTIEDYPKTVLDEYIFFDSKKQEEYLYSITNSIISYKITDEKLDTLKIIKEYPVDSDVPVMVISQGFPKKLIIKIQKDFPKNKIKEWYFKNSNDNTIKNIKGLSFKLKAKNDNYSSVVISKDSFKLSIRCSWLKSDFKRVDAINQCTTPLKDVINKINKIFPEKTLYLEPVSRFMSVSFNTKKLIPYDFIRKTVSEFKDIFEIIIKPNKTNDTLGLKYIPENISISIRKTNFFYDNKEYFSNSIDIINVSSEKEINTVIKIVTNLLISADKSIKPKFIFKKGKYIPIEEFKEDPVNKKKIANVKKLKNEGVEINSVSCQKHRQPIISSTEKVLKGSYPLIHKGKRFVCLTDKFKYPGFTNKNIVCCFTKDQRKKPIFLKNIEDSSSNKITNEELSDEDIINSNLIKTDKVLENNRLGLLPEPLYNIFDKTFYRLGVYYNRTSLLNAIVKATGKKIDINEIKQYISQHKKSLKYIINPVFNIESLIKYINNNFLNHKDIIDLLSWIFKVNIVIFEIKENKIFCKKNLYFPYENFIFLIQQSEKSYEIIVYKSSPKSLIYSFNKTKYKNIVSSIINIYKRSCIFEYTGFPDVPYMFSRFIEEGYKIQSQIVNAYNKVVYVCIKELGIAPVIPSKPTLNISINSFNKCMIDSEKQYQLFNQSKISYLSPTGQIVNKNKETVGIVTASGLITPTKPSKNIINLPIIYRVFSEKIDDLLKNKTPSMDNRYEYMFKVGYFKELYYRLKLTLSTVLNYSKNKTLKNSIVKVINDSSNSNELIEILEENIYLILLNEVTFSKNTPILPILNDTRNVCSELKNCSIDPFCVDNCVLKINKEVFDNYVKRLAIDIIHDKSILKGKVLKYKIDDDMFIKRKNEIILKTDKDMEAYLNG